MPFEDTAFGEYGQAEKKAVKAHELYENGKIIQAIDELDHALRINPANSSWHFDKALSLDALNRFKDAISEYEIALSLNPDDLEILNSLAVDYTRIGYYDLGIATFEHIQKLDPDFEPCYCNRIITYTEMNLHDLAEQMFYLAQQINPQCPLCYYNIGNSLFVRRDFKKAVSCWKKTALLDPNHPQINYRIAQAYWAQNDYENAKNFFLQELRTDPANIDAILDFGLLLLQTKNLESAKEKFNRIIELNPDFAPAFFYLGEIAYSYEDYQKAAELCKQTLEIDSTLPGPRYRLALCNLKTNNKKKAKAYLLAELQLEPQHPYVLVSMGSIFLELGDIDYAANCLLKAVDLDHANENAYYYLSCVNILKNRLEPAAEMLTHVLDINPNHLPSLKTLALVYLKLRRYNNAQQNIEKAKSIAPNDLKTKKIAHAIAFAAAAQRITDVLSCLIPKLKLKTSKKP